MKKNQVFGHYRSYVWKKTLRVMKLTTIILFWGVFSVAAEGFCQGNSISIRMENSSLKEVFQELKANSTYTFVYSENAIKEIEVDQIQVEDASLEQILEACLKDTGLDYYIDNQVVVIREKAPEVIQKQQEKKRELKGLVTDAGGHTLPGVSVVVKGTTLGVATNIDGHYSIKIPEGGCVLIFSFVGMIAQEIEITDQVLQNVSLVADKSQLSEVVVTGYQTISRERASGSFVTIDAEELQLRISENLSKSIEGLAPGLVTYGNELRVRGVNKLSRPSTGNDSGVESDYRPLIVIDGFATSSLSLDDINPADVESINVLKDAAAASIYGSRSANGVIIVTTKKGKKGKAQFSASVDYRYEGKPDFGYYDYASSSEVIDMEMEYLANYEEYQNDKIGRITELRNGGFTPSPALALMYAAEMGEITQAEANAGIDKLRKNNYHNDFKKFILQPKKQTQVNFNVSQGTDYSNMFLSFNYVKWKGDVDNNSSDQLRMNINNQLNFLDNKVKLTYGINAIYKESKNTSVNAWGYSNKLPYESFVDDFGNASTFLRADVGADDQQFIDDHEGLFSLDFNLLDELKLNKNESTSLNLRTNLGLNVKLAKWLNYDMKFSYEKTYDETEYFDYQESESMRRTFNKTAQIEDDGSVSFAIPVGDTYENNKSHSNEYLFRNQINFNNVFAEDHHVTFLAGNEIQQIKSKADKYKLFGYDAELDSHIPVDAKALVNGYSSSQFGNYSDQVTYLKHAKRRFASFYSNLGYSFQNKYNFTASIRYDLSNLFGQSAEYLYRPLWSVGASWNLTEESFINLEWLNRLKLRATYGINGNIPTTETAHLVAFYGNSRLTNQTTGRIYNPANPNLRWERTSTKNIGVDFSVLNNRLSGSFDYYKRFSDDLISNTKLDPTYGFEYMYLNNGEMENRGVEIALSGLIIKQKYFSWQAALSFSHNKNEVVDVDITPNSYKDYLTSNPMFEVGNSYYSIYGYKYAGLNAEGQPMVYNAEGEAVYEDLQDLDAIKELGVKQPVYSGSLRNSFSYKGFSLSALMIFHGGHLMSAWKSPSRAYGNFGEGASGQYYKEITKRWRKPGDELITDVPRSTFEADRGDGFRGRLWNYADRNFVDASFIKLRNLSLSYNLPEKYLSKIGAKSVAFSFQVDNAWYWAANNQGKDPEGLTTASYMFGLNVKF
ncbi:SusC/RagA family TonB-linked outer membrane protein [Ancylomarina salipaludis]|uniref:SusC/RagA family TonB-linked outer membrane protein n=1 Tax=Ancylomarina salipaludis TaxID=2501299 RepID=A0A4Q1JJ35_9BACT|nr:SusC/RagA family TonB-linked outer membrane protein [Ancylomarina salipaludis]RXQ88050.1 SusC/RagA family TonB-linked outer membrane protein [Ancylomarina salipaludis]